MRFFLFWLTGHTFWFSATGALISWVSLKVLFQIWANNYWEEAQCSDRFTHTACSLLTSILLAQCLKCHLTQSVPSAIIPSSTDASIILKRQYETDSSCILCSGQLDSAVRTVCASDPLKKIYGTSIPACCGSRSPQGGFQRVVDVGIPKWDIADDGLCSPASKHHLVFFQMHQLLENNITWHWLSLLLNVSSRHCLFLPSSSCVRTISVCEVDMSGWADTTVSSGCAEKFPSFD